MGVPLVTGTDTWAVVNTHTSPGSAPQNGPQLPRRAAWQISGASVPLAGWRWS